MKTMIAHYECDVCGESQDAGYDDPPPVDWARYAVRCLFPNATPDAEMAREIDLCPKHAHFLKDIRKGRL